MGNITQKQNVIQTIKRTVNINGKVLETIRCGHPFLEHVTIMPMTSVELFINRFLRESVEESPRRFVMEDLGLDIMEVVVALDSMLEAQDLMEVDLVLVELEVSETVNLMQNCYLKGKSKQIPEIKMQSILEDSFPMDLIFP